MKPELFKHIDSAPEDELRDIIKHVNQRLASFRRSKLKSDCKSMVGKYFRDVSRIFISGTTSGQFVHVIGLDFPQLKVRWFQQCPGGALRFCPTDKMDAAILTSSKFVEIQAEEFNSALKHMLDNVKMMA